MPGPYGSQVGALAVIRDWRTILVNELGGVLSEVLTAAGEAAGYVTVPRLPEGIVTSRYFLAETNPVIAIFKDSETTTSEFYNIMGPRRNLLSLVVRVQYSFTENPAEVEDKIYLLTRAVRECILRYWQGPYNTACLQSVNAIRSDEGGSSLREQFRQFGMQSYGRASENNNEITDLYFDCVQAVAAQQVRG